MIMHYCLVCRSVLDRSTGRLETEMLLKLTSYAPRAPGRKLGRVNVA
jgi:hypothetical protein